MKQITKRKKITICTLLFLGALLGIFLFWLQSGNSGEIKQTTSQKNQETAVIDTKLLDGQHMSFEHSATYFPRKLPNQDVDLELYQLDAGTAYVKKISASVSRLPDGTLNSNSAYLLRKNRADLYQKRVHGTGVANTEIWASYDNTEQTVFITRNSQAAILAFTQDGGDLRTLSAEVDAVIKSFKWK